MKKILYVVSNVYDSKEFEGLVANWDRDRFELEFVFFNAQPDCSIQRVIRAAGYRCTTIRYRSIYDSPRALRELVSYLRLHRPDVVHANLLEASFFTMLAGRYTGIGRLVYTRHHTLHNHKYHPVRGVLYDRIINALAHRIIAVAQNVVDVLVTMEKVPPAKVALIHHGFELDQARPPDPVRTTHLRRKYGFEEGGPWPVIGVISRPFEWKGLDHVIPAFERILADHPRARLMLFHWTGGAHSQRYEKMLERLPRSSWRTVRWETFVDDLFPMFDVFVHVPEDRLSEAFGFVYVETLTTGTPSVLTNSGILYELDPARLRGVAVVPFKDAVSTEAGIRSFLDHRFGGEERMDMARVNTAYLNEVISVRRKMERLYDFYEHA